MKVNKDTIRQLVLQYRDEEVMLEMLEDALRSFEEYHQAIYYLELKKQLYSMGAMEGREYRTLIEELDRGRTANHNAVLVQVNVLNRMAKAAGLPLFYEGVVSEERPYRREVANAVLEYVETVVRERS